MFSYKTPTTKKRRSSPKLKKKSRSQKRKSKPRRYTKKMKSRSRRYNQKRKSRKRDGMKRRADYDDTSKEPKRMKKEKVLDLDLYVGQYNRYRLEDSNKFDETYINYNENEYSSLRITCFDLIFLTYIETDYGLDTYFLSIAIFDKYMSKYLEINGEINIEFESLKLIAITSLILAAKFIEAPINIIDKIVHILNDKDEDEDDEHRKRLIVNIEINIFKAIGFVVEIPTSYYFLHSYELQGYIPKNKELTDLAEYILLIISCDQNSLKYKKSLLALCSIIISNEKTGKVVSDPEIQTLITYTEYTKEEITECTEYIKSVFTNLDTLEVENSRKDMYDELYPLISNLM